MKRYWLPILIGAMTTSCAPGRISPGSGPPELKCNNPNNCSVQIQNPTCGATGCSATVSADPIIFLKGANNYKVTWTLPAGYGFCDTAGDGVFLKEVDLLDQFEVKGARRTGGPTKDACSKDQFELTAKNTRSHSAGESPKYPYKVTFHRADGTGEPYVIDPVMYNE